MTLIIISVLSAIIVYAVSVMFAGIGEIFSELAGVMNMGLEGIMLMGAVTGYMTAVYTQNLALAFLAAVGTGALLGVVFAFLTVTLRSNQTVCGMAMLTFGTGLSGFLGDKVAQIPANLKFEKFSIPLLSKIPVVGPIFFQQDLLVYSMYLILPLSIFYIYHTRAGLMLRGLGEAPEMLDSQGKNIFLMRYLYVIFGCVMTAISGVCVSLSYTNFWSAGMTGGKGWIAIALVTFSSWNPMILAVGAFLFGCVSILGKSLQLYVPQIPSQVYSMLPYLVTIIAFILSTGSFRKKHTSQPSALGIAYDRESR